MHNGNEKVPFSEVTYSYSSYAYCQILRSTGSGTTVPSNCFADGTNTSKKKVKTVTGTDPRRSLTSGINLEGKC